MGARTKNVKRPYTSLKRAAARQATGDKIVAAASRVLRKKGWEHFSIEAVARAARVTRLTVYHQFGDRRALLESVFDRAARDGGLGGVAQAMALDDPHVALERIVEIFCSFWRNSGAMHGVVAAAMADEELARAIGERNERRRHLLGVIVGRMVERGDVDRVRARVLVDTLFALTSFAFHSELTGARLEPSQAVQVISQLTVAAVERSRP